MKCIFLLVLSALCMIYAPNIASNPVRADHIEVELLAEVETIRPGEPFWLALRLTPDEHWHVYWRNPGDSGSPPSVEWALPNGAQASEFQWPRPDRIPVAHLVNYGYSDNVLLLSEIHPPADLQGTTFSIQAAAKWLVCEELCIPGEATLTLELAVGEAAVLNPSHHKAFEQTRATWPVKAGDKQAGFVIKDNKVTIQIKQAPDKGQAAYFFPRETDIIEYAAPQQLVREGDDLQIQVMKNTYFNAAPETLYGVISFDNGRAYEISAQPGQIMAMAEFPLPSAPALTYSLWLMLLFALIGGLILNLMPCVFPVLCLKIISLTQSGALDRAAQRRHGIAYTLGVLASFALVGGVLIALRAGGAAIGWGFQLQSPWVIALLAYILFVMGLSLSGVVTFGGGIMGIGQQLTTRSGYQGSFFTGVLATIVATPCTAPFMATAVGFAATQPAPTAMAVFLALGFGLALPFLLLAWWPGWTKFLPKPGAWMETLKQFMAFPLYATVVWLLWVLGRQSGIDGLAMVLSGMVLLAFALWAWGRESRGFRIGASLIAAVIAVALLFSPLLTPPPSQQQADATAHWEPFSPERLDTLRRKGEHPVFVNMTADWCITCLVNEQVALNTEQVRTAFKMAQVTYLKGDWTRHDPVITDFLSQFARSGVPLYVLYPPNAAPIVLPQVLTPSIVTAALAGGK